MDFETNYRFRSDFYHDLKLHKEFNRTTRECSALFQVLHLVYIGELIWFFWKMVIVLQQPVEYAKYVPVLVAIWLLVEGFRLLATRGGGIHYKRSLMLNGGKPTNDSVFFCDDAIYTLEQESGNKATLGYDNVRIVYESEHLYLLGIKYNMFLMVRKDSLTCSREEFGQFLYEKCPKLQRKKVRKNRTGRIINCIKWTVILLSLMVCLFFHPWLQINKRIQGQIHNGMSLSEISTELESFGLTPLNDTDLVTTENGLFYLSDDKLTHLLFCMGEGVRDYDTGDFLPAESGVFFTYYWAEFPDTMYTDLLRGIDAMSREQLVIDNISEDHSRAEWANYSGSVVTDFTLNGEQKQINAVFYQQWYDEQILNDLNAMVMEATGKQLWFSDFEDTGCFIFLGDRTWANHFADRTGLILSSDINDIY